MSFQRWDYEFDGTYINPNSLKEEAGVYVIWCNTGNTWKILDVGESDNVVSRILHHDRADCWEQNCDGTIHYSATYISNQQERRDLENRIRSREQVICGEE